MGNIFKTLFNIGKGKAEEADKTLKSKNAVILGKQAISALDKKIKQYVIDCGDYSATIIVQKKDLAEVEADVKKWQKIAESQAKKGDADKAKKALEEKAKFVTKQATLKSEIARNEATLEDNKNNLAAARARLEGAESKIDTLEIRKKGADMRQQASGIGLDSEDFSAIDDLEDEVNLSEAKAEAYEEMKGVGNEAAQLEAEFDAGSSDVDDELAKLMAKNKKD